jgi:Type VI secretion system/phage-baseplate injector OB domain
MTLFHGKYRGRVEDNNDPLKLGRILALVPAIDDTRTNWALPCTPYADPHAGVLLLPPVGALVWIEFEGGAIQTLRSGADAFGSGPRTCLPRCYRRPQNSLSLRPIR